MSIRSVRKLLKNIQNIDEECSDERSSKSENEQLQSEDDLFDYLFD